MKKVIIAANFEEKCPYCASKNIEHTGKVIAKCVNCNNIMQLYNVKL